MCWQVYTAINHTLQSVFPTVTPYLQHLPSFADCWVGPACFAVRSKPI